VLKRRRPDEAFPRARIPALYGHEYEDGNRFTRVGGKDLVRLNSLYFT
jgi:hypothetical protein